MSTVELALPLDPVVIRGLTIGQWVHLTGSLYTARDAALQKICDLKEENMQPPADLRGHLVYFVGPTPAAPGEAIGSAGPTTSRRMEPFMPALFEAGVLGIMGKGPLSAGMIAEMNRRGVLYLTAIGGAGAYYGSKIRGAAVVAYEELGPEAIYSLRVEKFPAVVAVDLQGGNLFHSGPQAYQKDSTHEAK